MFRLAAILEFLLAIGHIACLPWLEPLFKMYGIDDIMNGIASYGAILPYIITIIIALCFALCGLYALSAAGMIRRLPLLWTGIYFIAFVFLSRAGIGCYLMINDGRYPLTDVSSVIVSGIIGLLYLFGAIERFKSTRKC